MVDKQNGSPDTGDILLGLVIIFGTPVLWGHRVSFFQRLTYEECQTGRSFVTGG